MYPQLNPDVCLPLLLLIQPIELFAEMHVTTRRRCNSGAQIASVRKTLTAHTCIP
jgi:hypothetical protein